MNIARILFIIVVIAYIALPFTAVEAQTKISTTNRYQISIYGSGPEARSIPEYIDLIYRISITINAVNASGSPSLHYQWIRPEQPPSQIVASGLGYLSLSYMSSYSISASQEIEGNTTYQSVSANAEFTIRIFINPTLYAGEQQIDLGSILYRSFGGNPLVRIYFSYSRYTHSSTYELDVSNVILHISRFNIYIKSVSLEGYRQSSNNMPGSIRPIYTIEVCYSGSGAFEANSVLLEVYGYSGLYSASDIVSRSEKCSKISGVDLSPGTNANLTVFYTVLDYKGSISKTVDLRGLVVEISDPRFIIVSTQQGSGSISGSFTVSVSGLGGDVYVSSSISYGSVSATCSRHVSPGETITISCEAPIHGMLDSLGRASITVSISLDGYTYQFTGYGDPAVYDPVSIRYVLSMLVSYAKLVLSTLVAVAVIMYGLSIVLSTLGMSMPVLESISRVLDQIDITFIIIFSIAMLAMIYVVIPAAISFIASFISSATGTSIPGCGSLNPELALSCVGGVVDSLFERMIRDYDIYVQQNIQSLILRAAIYMVVAFAIAFAAAASTFIAGIGLLFGNIMGAVSTTLTNMALAIMLMLTSIVPTAAIVLIGISIAPLIAAILIGISLILFMVGAILMAIPSPLARDYGYTLIGEGVLMMIVFPLLSIVSYGLYDYLIRALVGLKIENPVISAVFFGINIIYPVKEIYTIVSFYISSALTISIVLAGAAFMLTRTGVAGAIGESLVSLILRRT